MKIVISSAGKGLESEVDPRFGRCRYFLIVDADTRDFEVLDNQNAEMYGGAGIKTAQLVAGLGLNTVLTGNIGPNAFEVLNAAGIEILTGASGTIAEAVDAYRNGQLKRVDTSTVQSHAGMGKARRRGNRMTSKRGTAGPKIRNPKG
jgi:predicted Fe-Mo cluster-binding NifX family protein